MSVELDIPETMIVRAEQMAIRNGDTFNVTLLRALETCFPTVPNALQAEMDAWDAASEEDFGKWIDWIELASSRASARSKPRRWTHFSPNSTR